MPVILGRGGTFAVPDGSGTTTRSDRQTPIPGTTDVLLLQLASTQEPPFNTLLFESPQARQELDPGPEQLAQLESQAWQVELVLSKY